MKRTDISAQVTSGGKPLAGALIDFANHENGEAYGGTLDDQGRVDLKDVALGQYTITIQPPPGDPLPGAPRQIPKGLRGIPRPFYGPHTSPLNAMVSDDESKFTYELTDFDLSAKR
ncbi:carboxypeptidase-like regulatory domain-containing protein [Bremerella alba]|uniref:carboxypeptidase-like regulatory domain-containing protein n=1 Tax=Bremerella alba TaxID=980252 RepID=UPI001A955778|nr:carboxypeptidase-like regulatory domain-containing protein [Bremerella alba]